jgi:hypothetical protein
MGENSLEFFSSSSFAFWGAVNFLSAEADKSSKAVLYHVA